MKSIDQEDGLVVGVVLAGCMVYVWNSIGRKRRWSKNLTLCLILWSALLGDIYACGCCKKIYSYTSNYQDLLTKDVVAFDLWYPSFVYSRLIPSLRTRTNANIKPNQTNQYIPPGCGIWEGRMYANLTSRLQRKEQRGYFHEYHWFVQSVREKKFIQKVWWLLEKKEKSSKSKTWGQKGRSKTRWKNKHNHKNKMQVDQFTET